MYVKKFKKDQNWCFMTSVYFVGQDRLVTKVYLSLLGGRPLSLRRVRLLMVCNSRGINLMSELTVTRQVEALRNVELLLWH